MTTHPTTYLDRALAGELATLRNSANAGRNNTLLRVAARLYEFSEAGVISEDEMTNTLESEANAIGLSGHETRSVLKSARRRAARLDSERAADLRQKCSGERHIPRQTTPRAPEPCEPPSAVWRAAAGGLVAWSQQYIGQALDYLTGRGLTEQTIRSAGLGYVPETLERSRAKWGLPADEQYGDRFWLPAGIVIPWRVDGGLWKVQIRRDVARPDQDRYKTVPGSTNALYGVDSLQPGKPAILVEGAFDALAVSQAAGDVCGVVASGTSGARRVRWIGKLAPCTPMLIGFDADGAGDSAAVYWLDVLDGSKRWRPAYADPAQLLQDGYDVRGWVLEGLDMTPRTLPLAGLAFDYWREEARLNSPALERLARICAARGYDYQATIEMLNA